MCYWQILYVLIKNDREVKVIYDAPFFLLELRPDVVGEPELFLYVCTKASIPYFTVSSVRVSYCTSFEDVSQYYILRKALCLCSSCLFQLCLAS